MSNFLEHGGISQHKNQNMVASPKFKKTLFCHASLCFPIPLPHNLCKWKLNHGQTIWKKNEMIVGTWWERTGNFDENRIKTRKILSPPPLLNLKRKKTCIRSNVEPFHWGHKKFISQNCWSPTCTNSTIVSMGYSLCSTLWYIVLCIN